MRADEQPTPAIPSLELVVGGRRHTLEPTRPFVLGRGDGADLHLANPMVSRCHAVLEPTSAGWTLTDLGRNGTFLDGQLVTQITVTETTTVSLGAPPYGARITLVPADTAAARPEPDRASTISRQGRLSSSLTGSDQVRARCATDARYLRALRERATEISGPGLDLGAELHAIARDVSADGFRVTVNAHGTSVPLPGPVVRALTRAAREAVANAARHSGAGRGEVFLRHSNTRVTVEVIDHGHGRSASAGHDGLGVHRSIGERMADVGGRARVRHEPGVGTRVVLTWPR